MHALSRNVTSLFVDRSTGRWVVRDAEGRFWILPTTEEPWNQREPFTPSSPPDLEPVPGHYKSMLGLPF